MPITLLIIVITAGLCALGATVIIMHPRIHEGLAIKSGLILLALGSAGLAAHITHAGAHVDPDDQAMLRALAMCCAGLLVVMASAAWRIWRCPLALRAVQSASGWTPLDDQPEAEQSGA